jgi:pimeloyl-ACP methyl ester carboxylesterase
MDHGKTETRSSDVMVGAARLGVDAVSGLSRVVESMHATIAGAPFAFGGAPAERARGMTGAVYEIIRNATRLVGSGLERVLPALTRLDELPLSPRRELLVAALNGVLGDHLAGSGNPLAIEMGFRTPQTHSSKVVVLVHGLCASDRGWKRLGHDHGEALARDLGFAPVYLRYNSGRHISTNGRELAARMDDLLDGWPGPIEQLVLIGHSMGGLVARSACHYAAASEKRWLRRLDRLIFLGTPHHGAGLERAGNLVDLLLQVSPYAAPLGRIGGNRSAGITDLRFGSVIDEDWRGLPRRHRRDPRTPVPLPDHVQCHAVAASLGLTVDASGRSGRGDGLVSIASALGRHVDPRFALAFPAAHVFIAAQTRHIDLLSSPLVYDQIRDWLAPAWSREHGLV